jgi:hypothetical protein
MSAGADYIGYTSQQNAIVGTATERFYTANEYPTVGTVRDGDAVGVFAADHDVLASGVQTAIVYEGSVAVVLESSTRYSIDRPADVIVDGNVVFNAAALAELARTNLYEALAEYTVAAGTYPISTPWTYSDHYGEEPLPTTTFTEEPQPSQTDIEESLPPTYNTGQDGAWVLDEAEVVTEPPKDGAYTDIGYYKEWKPWWQTRTKENAPGDTLVERGAWTEVGTRGAWTEPITRGALTDLGNHGYTKERKPT